MPRNGTVPALYACFVLGINGSLDVCQASLSAAREKIPDIQPQATNLLINITSKIRKGTKVVVLGYPNIITEKALYFKEIGNKWHKCRNGIICY